MTVKNLSKIVKYFRFFMKIQKQPREVFYKKAVLGNFTKFTGKHLCQSLSQQSCRPPATLLKNELWHRCFLVNFAKFLRTPFSQNTSRRLLLKVHRLMSFMYCACNTWFTGNCHACNSVIKFHTLDASDLENES